MMKINIWSDVRCPFCYIGKRKFEKALAEFPHRDKVAVTWKSFQLDPTLKTQKDVDIYDYFMNAKGISRDHAEQLFNNATQAAEEVGLHFQIEKSVVSNSFNAHRLIQLAKTKELGNEAEEQLFKAHFVDGKDIDDNEVLAKIGVGIGLGATEVNEMLSSDNYANAVRQDELQAQSIGVRGVPFFVFNDKYAISGAQSPTVFLQVLEKSWEEFEKDNKGLLTIEGESCSTDGKCE